MNPWDDAIAQGNYPEAKRIMLAKLSEGDLDAIEECGKMYLFGECSFPLDVKAGEELLLHLSEINHNDYSYYIGLGYSKINNWSKARSYLETAAKNGQPVTGTLALCCYRQGAYESAYAYAERATDWEGALTLAYLYEQGLFVRKSRSKAHEYYVLAMQRGCTLESVENKAYATYYGSASQGKNVAKGIVKDAILSILGIIITIILVMIFGD